MFTAADLERDLSMLHLWREPREVARAAFRLLQIYTAIAPLGRRLIDLPSSWSDAHREVLLLFRHLAEELGNLRPEARCVLLALGEQPEDPDLPPPAADDFLALMINRIDRLAPVHRLGEAERSLLPLHLAETASEAEAVVGFAEHLAANEEREKLLRPFLWKLGASLEYHLARSHIFDRSAQEPGLLSCLDRLLGEPPDQKP